MRLGLSNSVRFEVFKRDMFTCQYCGKKAPDVVLNVDHIHPIAGGGTNDILNLITSCFACNSGKGDKTLSDASAVEKARRQAESTEEKKQQVEMMADWAVSLSQMEPELIAINRVLHCYERTLNEVCKKAARLWIRKYGLMEVLEVIALCYDRYSHEEAWAKAPAILRTREAERADPSLAIAGKVVSRMVGRMGSWDWKASDAKRLFSLLIKRGYNPDDLEHDILSNCRTWSQARSRLQETADQAS